MGNKQSNPESNNSESNKSNPFLKANIDPNINKVGYVRPAPDDDDNKFN
jgi:hypothetical protein